MSETPTPVSYTHLDVYKRQGLMDVPLLYEIVTIFLLSIFVTVTCNKIKLPATVGFLLTGVLCGPSLLGIVSDRDAIDHVAEIGVAMLLFTIGMELSGEALNRLKRPVFLGGSLQIGLTVLVVMGLALFGGYTYQQGIFMGCLVALSSSAVVLRIMQERGSTNTPTGRLSLAILVFQDIMVAVSYTHLDVYKRQTYTWAPPLPRPYFLTAASSNGIMVFASATPRRP